MEDIEGDSYSKDLYAKLLLMGVKFNRFPHRKTAYVYDNFGTPHKALSIHYNTPSGVPRLAAHNQDLVAKALRGGTRYRFYTGR